jgi:hypothetical protein
MLEKLGLLPLAINSYKHPIQGQYHARRVANVEADIEWGFSNSFRNPSLYVIDAGDYSVNINPLLQLNLLHSDTFFGGLKCCAS